MTIMSGGMPHHTIYQLVSQRWICKGGDQRGYGDTPEQAYDEWVYLIRYNSDRSNW